MTMESLDAPMDFDTSMLSEGVSMDAWYPTESGMDADISLDERDGIEIDMEPQPGDYEYEMMEADTSAYTGESIDVELDDEPPAPAQQPLQHGIIEQHVAGMPMQSSDPAAPDPTTIQPEAYAPAAVHISPLATPQFGLATPVAASATFFPTFTDNTTTSPHITQNIAAGHAEPVAPTNYDAGLPSEVIERPASVATEHNETALSEHGPYVEYAEPVAAETLEHVDSHTESASVSYPEQSAHVPETAQQAPDAHTEVAVPEEHHTHEDAGQAAHAEQPHDEVAAAGFEHAADNQEYNDLNDDYEQPQQSILQPYEAYEQSFVAHDGAQASEDADASAIEHPQESDGQAVPESAFTEVPAVMLSVSTASDSEEWPLFTRPAEAAVDAGVILEDRRQLFYEPIANLFSALRDLPELWTHTERAAENEMELDAYELDLTITEVCTSCLFVRIQTDNLSG